MIPRGGPLADDRPGLSACTLLFIAGVYFSVLTVVGFWLWQRCGGSFATRAVDDISSLSGILFAALCSAWAARSARGRVRHGWRAMTAGLLGWAIGEVIWSYYELVLGYEQSPYPSLADAFYLMYPVGAGVAVVLLSTSKTGRSRIRLVLDGLIVAASLFVVSWISVIENVFRAGGESHLALAVSLAYPVADVVIITIAWASAVVAYRPSMGLLVAGLIIVALSDSVFSGLAAVNDYYTGNLIDLGWLAGCGALGLAALRSIGEPPREQASALVPRRARLWLPYLPLVLASCVATAKILPGINSIPFAAAVLVPVIGVLARQFVALAENQRLLSDVGRLAFTDQLTGLAALRRLRTRLSLDDDGTRWSSLARLQDLSVDELKLDQVFVARLALDPRSIAIVRSTVALAHSLGADLVADGVEDDATLRALRQYGCTSHRATCIVLPFPPRRFRSGSRRVAPRRDRGDARGLRAFDRPFADKNRNDGKENETSAILRTWTGERAAKSSHYRGTPSTKCRLESCSSEYPCPPSPLPETAKYCLPTRHSPRWLDTPRKHCSRWSFLSSSGWCQPMSLQFLWSVSTRTSLSS